MSKYVIEKNSVQETLIIPLYARKLCTELFPEIYRDDSALNLLESLDYDFSNLEKQSKKSMYAFGALEAAMRQMDMAWEIKNYLKDHPKAAVVNLGCGLDQSGRMTDNGTSKIYNLDFPSVIEVRNELLPPGDREVNLPCDLNDFSWMDKIDASEGVIFFAAGVFYYFQRESAKKMITEMARRFPGGRLVFDSCGKLGLKMMLKTWIKQAKIKDVGAYFYVANIKKDLAGWDNIKPSSKGYMLGYNSLNDKSVSPFFRFLAKLGDGPVKMKIVRLDFFR